MQQPSDSFPKRHSGERRRKTRDLILKTARELFNERGEANVTLAHIGAELGISEGNVWYHFRTKRDLIFALFLEMQEQINTNQQIDLGDFVQTNRVGTLLTRGFSMMWEYRFLLRDHMNWMIVQPEVHAQLMALTVQGLDFIKRVLEHLVQLELLAIEAWRIPSLATNIWITARYWIDYCQSRSERNMTEQDIQEGIGQVRALILPYLTPLALSRLNLAQDRADT